MNDKNAAQRTIGALSAIIIATFVGAGIEACTPGQRQAARTVLDAAQVACVIANAALSDADVARVCGIVDGLDDPLRKLLAAQREQVAAAEAHGRSVAGCSAADAGAEGGGK